ncbi:MAG: hypothetical protein EP343_03805 [Deltaproteobacteria bacterium]|nr:MAG: hypothetical protein EP343_03805 [Deltaproteobacteria bacterium]
MYLFEHPSAAVSAFLSALIPWPRRLRLGLMCLALSVWGLALGACQNRSTTQKSLTGPRFVVDEPGSCRLGKDAPATQMVGGLCGTDQKACRVFRDRHVGLGFCVPGGTKMQELQFRPYDDPLSFEVRLLLESLGVALYLRRDPLPDGTPEGALSSSWLLRYAETYMQRRGGELRDAQRRILSPKRSKFLHANAAVWAAFPFVYGGREYWEEFLVMSRGNSVRYLISIRMAAELRQDNPKRLQTFLTLFLHQLRLGAQLSK